MNIFSYIILGIVQGVGEFLPISSSGHLIIAKHFVNVPEDLVLDVTLHIATLLAVLVFYRLKLLTLLKSFFKDILISFKYKKISVSEDTKYIFYILLACVPTFLIGFIFKDFFESQRSVYLVCFMLIFISFFMLLDVLKVGLKDKKLNFVNSFLIGFFQVIALLPGASRSGVTITSASLMGIDKKKAADFSFLLSIPAILAAFVFELKDVKSISYFLNLNLIVAFVTAFVFGFLSIKVLLKVLNKYGFLPFIVYRVLLATAVLIILGFK